MSAPSPTAFLSLTLRARRAATPCRRRRRAVARSQPVRGVAPASRPQAAAAALWPTSPSCGTLAANPMLLHARRRHSRAQVCLSLPQAQACVHSPSAGGVALVLPTTSRAAMESGWPMPQVRERDLSAGRERRGWERRVWAEGNKKIKK